jgi:hypothetical protein
MRFEHKQTKAAELTSLAVVNPEKTAVPSHQETLVPLGGNVSTLTEQ